MPAPHMVRDINNLIGRSIMRGMLVLCAVLAGIVSIALLAAALFIASAARYGDIVACLIVAGAFIVLAGSLILTAIYADRRRTLARKSQATTAMTNWLEPSIIATGLDVIRMIGGRRATTLAAGAVALYWLFNRPSESAES